jgi:acyl carrier protein
MLVADCIEHMPHGVLARSSMIHTAAYSETFARVCALLTTLIQHYAGRAPLAADARLIEDLGLDSLKFVDLTVAIERSLSIADFPMHDWLDSLTERGEAPTVDALARVCHALRAGADGRAVASG